jgi:hypothetical protein
MAQTVNWYVGSDNVIVHDGMRRMLSYASITQSAGTATLTAEAHGCSAGDVIRITGAEQEEYNGDHTVLAGPATNSLTFTVDSGAETPASGDIEASVYLGATTTVTTTFSPTVGVGTLTGDYKGGSRGRFEVSVPDTATFSDGTEYTATSTFTAPTGEVLKVTHIGDGVTYP